jgi:predicted dehydrogenase
MPSLDRRRFLGQGALGALGLLSLPSLMTGGCAEGMKVTRRPLRPKGEALRLAIVGVANQGHSNLSAVAGERIVALCDVDANYLEAAGSAFPDAKRFRDGRELLADSTLDLDGVVISTPDHTHAPFAAMALGAGLAAYVEKPLTHTVEECRVLGELARDRGAVTQMGTLIHAGSNYRRVVELIRAGAIGRITQVDTWCPKAWCCSKPTPGAQAPKQLDWELWQGPAERTEYIEGIHPANWRGHWRYGTGTLGDMGCHILDLPMWALGLDQPAWDRCQIYTEGSPLDATGCPAWLEVSWAFPQKGTDPLVLRWFDGGRIPPLVQELGAKDRQDYFGRFMVCFQGTRGFLMANYGEYQILQAGEVTPPPPSIAESPGHHREWLNAIRDGRAEGEGSPLCRFSYATKLTELVLGGTVAYRLGRPLEWNRSTPVSAMPADVRSLCARNYHNGWTLG